MASPAKARKAKPRAARRKASVNVVVSKDSAPPNQEDVLRGPEENIDPAAIAAKIAWSRKEIAKVWGEGWKDKLVEEITAQLRLMAPNNPFPPIETKKWSMGVYKRIFLRCRLADLTEIALDMACAYNSRHAGGDCPFTEIIEHDVPFLPSAYIKNGDNWVDYWRSKTLTVPVFEEPSSGCEMLSDLEDMVEPPDSDMDEEMSDGIDDPQGSLMVKL
ncbi:hypothetical protein BJ508DRAFT_311006 [Ascobolus immersus RN42]|uniref:Uncharacterized protein n=1 Tax=Ascobolus immersus RN42 TaxID=1160509 RepID=A0A3N4HVE0_ASCIM|nr:hypothetical protein BJ508DRAFT_311006 [Ascobolus immersus RN42]